MPFYHYLLYNAVNEYNSLCVLRPHGAESTLHNVSHCKSVSHQVHTPIYTLY